jgi:hypothetical protein
MKSAVTFFRKQLGFKGSTDHNGRGVYVMDISDSTITADDVNQRIRHCLPKWESKDMVEKVVEDAQYISITLKDELFDIPEWKAKYADMSIPNNSYRTLCFNKTYGSLGVVMTFTAVD